MYAPKDLKTQLIEFAARRVVAKVVDAAASAAGRRIQAAVHTSELLRSLSPSNSAGAPTTFRKGTTTMAFRNSAAFAAPTTANKAAAQRGTNAGRRNRDEPVELWVNTVIVTKDGAEPIRILTGRPLRSFNADRDVTTSNEEYNRANAIHNAFVNRMNADAESLNLGEARYYSPAGTPTVEVDGVLMPDLKAGIYLQLFREVTDPAQEAAAKLDIEAQATSLLNELFGN